MAFVDDDCGRIAPIHRAVKGSFLLDTAFLSFILFGSGENSPRSTSTNETVAHDRMVRIGCVCGVDDDSQHHHRIRVESDPYDGQGVIRMKPLHLVLIGFGSVVAAKIVKGLLTGWLGISF
jgi:hypothetical protein